MKVDLLVDLNLHLFFHKEKKTFSLVVLVNRFSDSH